MHDGDELATNFLQLLQIAALRLVSSSIRRNLHSDALVNRLQLFGAYPIMAIRCASNLIHFLIYRPPAPLKCPWAYTFALLIFFTAIYMYVCMYIYPPADISSNNYFCLLICLSCSWVHYNMPTTSCKYAFCCMSKVSSKHIVEENVQFIHHGSDA